jgi:two-component system, OmpR family, sensor histidine kinase ArlS
MKLRNKLFLQHTLTICMLLTAMYFIMNYMITKSIIERDTQTLNQYYALHKIEALKIVNDKKMNIKDLFSGSYAPLIASHLASNNNFQVQLFSNDQTIVGSSIDNFDLLKRGDIEAALQGQVATVITETETSRYFIYSAPFWYQGTIVGGIRYVLDMQQYVHMQQQMKYWFAGVAGVCLVLSLLSSFTYFSLLLKPVYELKQALKLVSIGVFSKKIKVNSKDEIAELASDFNEMSDALNQHIRLLKYEQNKQKVFYDNMTHELKTPLTSIIGFSDLIEKMNKLEDARTCSKYIRKEGTRLLTMVEELLETSLKGEEAWRINLEFGNLAEVVSDTIRILEPTIRKSALQMKVELTPCLVCLDPVRTQQVLFNIIDNAIQHSDCRQLYVTVEEWNGSGRVLIRDNGKGIPMEEQNTLFLPVDQKSNRPITRRSHGLGLPICKQLIEMQGGSIRLTSVVEQGTEVELIFNKRLPI